MIRIPTLLLLLATATAIDVSAAEPGARIVDGTLTTQHPAVGYVFDVAATLACTGALVAPEWVLTTAVCAETAEFVGFGNDFTTPEPDADFYEVTEAIIHPSFVAGGIDFNIALLRLQTPATGITPLALKLGARSQNDVGLRGTLVGFGVSDASPATGDGRKRSAVLQISSVEENFLIAAQSSPNGCFGDMGGPLIAGSPSRVIGIMVFGDINCSEFTGIHRLDVVAGFLDASAPVCPDGGGCVRILRNGFEAP